MFQAWRLKLREADEALKAGRLEDASRMLCQGDLQQFLPAKQLLAKVAAEVVARGTRHALGGESSAGWRDLEIAAEMGAEHQSLSVLRKQLVDHSLAEAERYLHAGNVDGCLTALEGLDRHKASTVEARQLKHAARRVDLARRMARHGKFAEAEAALTEAAALRSRPDDFADARDAYRRKGLESQMLQEELHRALATQDWTAALSAAERLLQLAPQCTAALDARRRAWNAVGMQVAATRGPATLAAFPGAKAGGHAMSQNSLVTLVGAAQASPRAPARAPGRRFTLWIDGVGGYLVCEGADIVIGQPDCDGQVDVPILADISRHHARIRREGEGYLLTPLRPTSVNGRPVSVVTSLADGNLIEMGQGVQLRFRRPHPLSLTARLEFVSRHRTQPSVDSVLLFADSCLLGPAESHHVCCPGWAKQVVLYRQGEELYCRAAGPFEIDSHRYEGQGPVTRNAQISGDDFSFSLEEVG